MIERAVGLPRGRGGGRGVWPHPGGMSLKLHMNSWGPAHPG